MTREDTVLSLMDWLVDEASHYGARGRYFRHARHAVLEAMGVPQPMGMFVAAEHEDAMRHFREVYCW